MKLGEMTWAEVEAMEKDKIVILPLGSFEQHGRHLPFLTDTLIVKAISEKVEAAKKEKVLLLPPLWLGYSPHHLGFPGTVTIEWHTYIQLLCQILSNLIKIGFRKILVLNAHDGNDCMVRVALREVRRTFDGMENLHLVMMSNWSVTEKMLHACEVETSLMLYLHPELVKMEEAEANVKEFHSEFYSFDFDKPDRVTVDYSFKEASKTGALGHPSSASAQEGEWLIEKIVTETIQFIEEFVTW